MQDQGGPKTEGAECITRQHHRERTSVSLRVWNREGTEPCKELSRDADRLRGPASWGAQDCD